MYGSISNIYSYYEFQYSYTVRQTRQPVCFQVRVLAILACTLFHFITRHISNVPQTRGWEKKIADGPPCVVLASPGFMDVGPSRELFELWAPDSRNGLIITGYSIEGTLARVSRTISGPYIGIRKFLCILGTIYRCFLFHPHGTQPDLP